MKYWFFIVSFFIFFNISSQVNVGFKLQDSLHNPISDAYVSFNNKGKSTNQRGEVFFLVKKGNYKLSIKHLVYQDFDIVVSVTQDTIYPVFLQDKKELLQEIVVTAKESNNITATSEIDRRAMSHLQPSSFSDLMSLLPGNSVSSPVLNSANNLLIRETGIIDANNDYATSSLGVSFLIDGAPINSNANLQQTIASNFQINPLSFGGVDQRRRTVRSGVDMRAIATDAIEKIEVVRGIASAKYGDLSSGLIKIKRKQGETRWDSRVKSDGFSKLFHVGKGFFFDKSNLSLNFDVNYLDAKSDPRNQLENYERITTSIRLQKIFESSNPITWSLNADYTSTLDGEETDPDIGIENLDRYKSTYKSIRIANELNINFSESLLRNLNFKVSVNSSNDRIEQTRWQQITRATSLPISREEGESYGVFLEPSYLSELIIDGKPLDIFSDFSSAFAFKVFNIEHELTVGGNYSYAKNNGLGQLYDPRRPPVASVDTRPRAFKEIPALQNVAFYLEDIMKWSLNKTNFTFRAGLRGNAIVGLNDRYIINGKLFLNPRLNVKVDLPRITFKNEKSLNLNITAGYGKQSKLPTQNMLFPQDQYVDFEQLNYFHPNKDFRRVHYQTYILPRVNYDIQPALNLKKEIRLGVNYDYHSLFVTYFDESMNSGFRSIRNSNSLFYKEYDTSDLDPNMITEAPAVENLPFQQVEAQVLTTKESNGSAIDKKGIEFQYTGKRLEIINTRFTVSGAWLQTKYYNSLPFLSFAENRFVNGVFHSNIGVYKNNDSFLKESLQTSFTADTYFQKLRLTTSLRTDIGWYGSTKGLPRSTVPFQYINEQGKTLPYTAMEANDPVLQSLIRTPDGITEREILLSLQMHLKISKKFYKYVTISMYVNNLFNYFEVEDIGDQLVARRSFVEPYFGMEMNIKF
ncbi:TonB-dependent receptor plug domain-containing protein [Tenacibaculum agarivorans]|uniref:TonB-dependent receptor plug domain-containing protein n=1 Tax=Tenacibaculum agarivorans TaxID=1908389 RepID=UPI00094B90B8|nr:TonB-dependent receptor plug domain-containing protein [Tenacibaculum agarivorans]